MVCITSWQAMMMYIADHLIDASHLTANDMTEVMQLMLLG